ncbi:hypothetical protein EDWATA_01800 [Edwardsiella tarda ATCC 23685]|uniref:Uncharacterized protein n=1 Tax=Edwardsiella tarda ATCC 23685 TaxID=500638 RepID=D4F4X3_EDWTA|nr:hypothetical protein EDWATA_01800 [Edwardsiella tarda ATCC 23685]
MLITGHPRSWCVDAVQGGTTEGLNGAHPSSVYNNSHYYIFVDYQGDRLCGEGWGEQAVCCWIN